VLRARTAEASHTSLLCVTEARRALGMASEAVVEIGLPSDRSSGGRRRGRRTVRYLARIVEAQEIGQLIGLSIDLLQKLR